MINDKDTVSDSKQYWHASRDDILKFITELENFTPYNSAYSYLIL